MATPRQIHLVFRCGLEIEIDKSAFKGLDYTNSSLPWRYNVTNCDQIVAPNHRTAESFGGWVSPISRITLPQNIKKNSGIPDAARSYAFMYPPEGLAEALVRKDMRISIVSPIDENFDVNPGITDESAAHRRPSLGHIHVDPEISKRQQAIESAAILGGFAYFDENYECICINALSTQRSERTLKFSGPYEVKQSACDEILKMRRLHPLQVDIFHEVGFVSYAWVRPKELFRFEGVFVKGQTQNNNGTMIFFREDGTGVAYAIDNTGSTDPTGYVGILSEPVLKIGEAKYTHHRIQPLYEVKDWGAQVKHWRNGMNTTKLYNALEDKRTAIHMACHAALGHEFISNVLSYVEYKRDLSYQDHIGWNPLHYACRFSPSDYTLIKLLVTECPEAVVQVDFYNRSPLHIACNSDTSEKVIAVLLEADTNIPKITIKKTTRRFGFLPLHLACFSGLDDGIINALLDADSDNNTVVQKSYGGHLPLHLALSKKLPASVVKAFLDVDTKLRKAASGHHDSVSSNFTATNFTADIYQSLNGKLPLHIACYNNSSSEIVQLLIEKDRLNVTMNENVDSAPSQALESAISSGLYQTSSFRHGSMYNYSQPSKNQLSVLTERNSEYIEQGDGVVALHLAMRHGNKAVVSLLLWKEMGKAKDKHQLSMLQKRDVLGRTPLHIACQYNISSQIILYLLDLDPFNKTTQMTDLQGFMPIHTACENKFTSAETINMLLDAEDQYIEHEFNLGVVKSRSTHTGDTERKRTPLYLAVRNGVDANVIRILLKPKNFFLKGFDDPAMEDLAEVVIRSPLVQAEVIEKLSDRVYFCQLVTELYASVIAVIFFFYGSYKYVEGKGTAIEPCIVLSSAALFTLREVLQILSVGTDYLGDLWSLFEVITIVLLVVSSTIMLSEEPRKGEDLPQHLLITTGLFVVMQFILILRNTIQPFARFVGGLLLIVKQLVPFIVVNLLVLWFFVYAWWIKESVRGSANNTIKLRFQESFMLIFDFSERDSDNSDADTIGLLHILFALLIIIVLFNILIAIVGEAWQSSDQISNGLFWKYRLEKIKELRYATKYQRRFVDSRFSKLMEKIDNIRYISYGSDISWNKSPYHLVDTRDHYENPQNYFGAEQSKVIHDARSLNATMYWEEMSGDVTSWRKAMILLGWFGSLIRYGMLVILGFPTLGILWPKKFRASLLSWDDSVEAT